MHKLGPVEVADYHVAGQPFRIVTAGAPRLEGGDSLDRRERAKKHLDELRRLLTNEPRGHAATSGCFLSAPGGSGADIDAVFFHQGGFDSAAEHGAIALATWAVESGTVPVQGDHARVVIDVPTGRLDASVHLEAERVISVAYTAGPAYVAGRFIPLQLPGDVVSVDLAYAGVYLAMLDATEVGVTITPENTPRFAILGREIEVVLRDHNAVVHPTDHRLSGFGGTVFYEVIGDSRSGLTQKSITVSADGRVGRSPSGAGLSARLALLDSAAELSRGAWMVSDSPLGTTLAGRVVGDAEVGGIHGVITEIKGTAHRTGEARVWLDERDTLGLGGC